MKLNRLQKIFMAIIGVFILAFQIYKFSEDGVDGYSWVFSILISAGLMLPLIGSFGENQQEKNSKEVNNKNNVILSSREIEELEKEVNPLLTEINFESTLLFTHIYKILDVKPKGDIEKESLMMLMMDQWRVYCVAYIYALVCLRESSKDEKYVGSNKCKLFRVRTIEEMVKISKLSAEKNNIGIEFNIDSSKEWAKKDLDDSEIALNKMIRNFENKKSDPDIALVEYLSDKMKIPIDSKDAFIKDISVYTKNLLSSMKKR